MEVDGGDRGCNVITGRFELFDLQTDPHGTVVSFVLEFEQHCEGGQTALFGQLLYNASGPAKTYLSIANARAMKGETWRSSAVATALLSQPASTPVDVGWATFDGTATAKIDYVSQAGHVRIPAGSTSVEIPLQITGNRTATYGRSFHVTLSAPPSVTPGVSAATVAIIDPNSLLSVMAFNSQPGDYIGEGIPWLEFPSYTSFRMQSSTGCAGVTLGEPNFWSLNFAAPTGHTLEAGTYVNAERYPFQTPGVPGLSIYGNGAGCNIDIGFFAVNQIAAASPTLFSTLSIDFEQICDSSSGALFGSMRINAVLRRVSVTDGLYGAREKFFITINPVAKTPTTVFFQTMDGTALAGTDYTAVSTSVTIPAGASMVSVKVPLLGTSRSGRSFYGMITSPDLPVVWNAIGAARI